MYLIEIDPITGLIKDDEVLDGWKAIPSFLALFEKEGYGIKAITCVALVMDYTSIIKNYSEKERPIKAMEIVFDNRKALNWNCDEIQLACINYKELQYNPTLEEKSLLEELRISKLNEIKNVKSSFEKTTLLRELGSINDLVKSFEAKNGTANTFNESPVRNGYVLSRLEIKILDQKSFYYDRKKRKAEERRAKESDSDK